MAIDIITRLVESQGEQIALMQEKLAEVKGMLTVSSQQIALVLQKAEENGLKQKDFETRLHVIESAYKISLMTWKALAAIFVTFIALDFSHIKAFLSLLSNLPGK